jgi:dienelactone hydrolase
MCCSLFFLLAGVLPAAEPVDWPALIQKPHAGLAVPNPGLRPLLVDPAGRKITTTEQWEKARAALRSSWLAHLGPAPAKAAALDVRIEKSDKLDSYTRHLLSFASEGDDRIRAYLLVPTDLGKGERRPAVVVFHETTRDTLDQPVGLGKKPELALALELTRRGYVTLSPECYILKDKKGWAAGQAAALGRRRPDWTGMGKMTFDASRCVDYLETVPQADPKKIGCIGFSLGAKEVLYALAFEPRYRAGVFNEGGIGLRMSNWTDAWYLTAKMKAHIPTAEHHQVLALVAPRPLLLMGGGSADGDASWAFIREVLPVYQLYGARERIGLLNHGAKHTFPREARQMAYRWLDHWLGHKAPEGGGK